MPCSLFSCFDFQTHAFTALALIDFPYKESEANKSVGSNSVLGLARKLPTGATGMFYFWLENRPVVVKG